MVSESNLSIAALAGNETSAMRPAVLRAAAYLAIGLAVLAFRRDPMITPWFFLHQDLLAGIALVGAWLAALWLRPRLTWSMKAPRSVVALAIATLLALALWWGTHALMLDYPLTRDELMAGFDQSIFASGRLSVPLPAAWAGYALALVPDYLLDVPDHALLVSGYGPVNAAMRAAFWFVADPALLNPLLAAGGLLALHQVVRRLFADCAGAQWLVLIGYVVSAQIAVNAMTSYAMTAHLTVNMIWLALYLRDKWWSHLVAIALGALAIGLHQVVFHPLFAGPFLILLLVERRWRLFATYAAVYLIAIGFWMSWPHIVISAAHLAAQHGASAGGGGFIESRVTPLLLKDHRADVPLLFYNLVRASVWNAAFLIPFGLLALPAVRRREGIAVALAAGVVLTIVTITFLQAYQGHGWGYRYVHAVLGNCLLLAGYGYRELARNDERESAGYASVLIAASLPIAAWLMATTHGFVAHYSQLNALVLRQKADFVIVDTNGPGFAVDLVRNSPNLSNRPLIFSSRDLDRAQVSDLCKRGRVTVIGRRELRRDEVFLRDVSAADPLFDQQVATLANQRCVVPVSGQDGE